VSDLLIIMVMKLALLYDGTGLVGACSELSDLLIRNVIEQALLYDGTGLVGCYYKVREELRSVEMALVRICEEIEEKGEIQKITLF
jgi:hypothetical protein